MTDQTIAFIYLQVLRERFLSTKQLGEKTIAQLSENELHYQPNEQSNSIAVIIKHMSGNMVSRWSDFLTSDGEKSNRNRDQEFIEGKSSKETIFALWEKGWQVVMETLNYLNENDLTKIITIRGETHTVIDAIERQMAHYGYHVGQIVYVGKMLKGEDWETLSIARGQSEDYRNQMMKKSRG